MYLKEIRLVINYLQIIFYYFGENNMKSSAKSKIIILITLGILSALSSIFSNSLNFDMKNSDNSTNNTIDFNLDDENPKISKVSGPISITGNSGWSTAESIGICTGNGIYSDPYVLEDLVIVSGGSVTGIWISSSNVYFKIENCTVSNYDDGISLVNVNNGQLINNNATNNSNYGIYLENSNNNTISGNTAYYNTWNGITLSTSNNNTISGNTANNNFGGLYLLDSNSNTISGNTLNNNTYGMELWYSNYSTVSGNIANGNDWVGIMLRDNYDNTVSGNIANYNNLYAGIALWESCYNDVSENNANDNLYSGIY